jgi:hypothetical protein
VRLVEASQGRLEDVAEAAKMPRTDEWIKKMWHLCTMKFYSAIKKNEILLFAGKWMEVENIILSEVSQVQTAKDHVFSHMWSTAQYKYSDIMKHR